MKKLHIIIGVLIFVGIVILSFPLINALIPFKMIKDTQGLNGCPDTVEGDYDADFTIKYFYSPNCLYCLGEEKIFEELIKEKGYLFRLEKYDMNYCSSEAIKYGASKVPSFVFVKDGSYFTRDTFLPKNALERTICVSSGGCF